MNAEKLIQAAEYCAIEAHETCQDCPMYDDCPADDRDPVDIAIRLLAVRDHSKAEGRAEGRAEVVEQVMEWASKTSVEDMTTECCGRLLAMLGELAGEESMAKIWCEKCYGTGRQQWQQSSQNVPYDEPCESCDGKGYTKAEVVDVEKLTSVIENSSLDDEDVIQEIIKLASNVSQGAK